MQLVRSIVLALSAGVVPAAAAQAAHLQLLSTIPLATGQHVALPPRPCLGTSATVETNGQQNPNDWPALALELPNNLSLHGNTSGGITLLDGNRRIGTLHMPPAPTSQYRMGRLGVLAHTGGILEMKVLADGRTVVTRGNDNTVRVWDVPTRRMLAVHPGASAFCVLQSDASGAFEVLISTGRAELWTYPQGRRVWQGPALLRSNDLRTQHELRSVSGWTATTVQLGRDRAQWLDRTTGREIGERRGPPAEVAFSPDHHLLALLSSGGEKVEVFTTTGQLKMTLPVPERPAYVWKAHLSFSPDNRVLSMFYAMYSRMIIEVPLDQMLIHSFLLKAPGRRLGTKDAPCTTRSGFSDLLPAEMGSTLRTFFNGKAMVYYDGSPKIAEKHPSVSILDGNFVNSNSAVFDVLGTAMTYDFVTGNFFTVKNKCELYETEGRVPALKLKWPGAPSLHLNLSATPLVSSRFIAIDVRENDKFPDGVYVFNPSTGNFLGKFSVDRAVDGFMTPDTLLVTTTQGLGTMKMQVGQKNTLHVTTTMMTSTEENMWLSLDQAYAALTSQDSVAVYRLRQ